MAHAVNAMQAQGVQLNDKYLDSAKAYYKAKYKARYGCEKAADQDAAAKKACQEEPHTAKDDMKKATALIRKIWNGPAMLGDLGSKYVATFGVPTCQHGLAVSNAIFIAGLHAMNGPCLASARAAQ